MTDRRLSNPSVQFRLIRAYARALGFKGWLKQGYEYALESDIRWAYLNLRKEEALLDKMITEQDRLDPDTENPNIDCQIELCRDLERELTRLVCDFVIGLLPDEL